MVLSHCQLDFIQLEASVYFLRVISSLSPVLHCLVESKTLVRFPQQSPESQNRGCFAVHHASRVWGTFTDSHSTLMPIPSLSGFQWLAQVQTPPTWRWLKTESYFPPFKNKRPKHVWVERERWKDSRWGQESTRQNQNTGAVIPIRRTGSSNTERNNLKSLQMLVLGRS